jgi:hypothetical protein
MNWRRLMAAPEEVYNGALYPSKATLERRYARSKESLRNTADI